MRDWVHMNTENRVCMTNFLHKALKDDAAFKWLWPAVDQFSERMKKVHLYGRKMEARRRAYFSNLWRQVAAAWAKEMDSLHRPAKRDMLPFLFKTVSSLITKYGYARTCVFYFFYKRVLTNTSYLSYIINGITLNMHMRSKKIKNLPRNSKYKYIGKVCYSNLKLPACTGSCAS